jgi:two-component system, OmpR family, sensor histidine kinase TctE
LQGREDLINHVLLGVVLPQLLLIILAAMAVWFGVARGLRPLRGLQDAVSSRSPSDLRPLVADAAPREVKPLVSAINDLLGRLREDRDAQKRFVANAAHQLRTPLAGLKTQTELAERNLGPEELRHTLRHIRTSVDRATRLVHQLLSLARVEPSAFKTNRLEPVDINCIARDATTELVPQALSKHIDLGFEGLPYPCVLMGDARALFELASNLIENAILYTQPGGKVTVLVESPERPRLLVEDNGPGIPEAEQELVFERFYRALGTSVDGSGLGLAIVREIAETHGASVRLSSRPDGTGTAASVQFPPAVVTPGPVRMSLPHIHPAEPPYARL